MGNLLAQVDATLKGIEPLSACRKILVAVSGGADSMVLLHILAALNRNSRWQLGVVHLDHQLRGRSSRADARLVRETARRLRIPCFEQSADVAAFAKSRHISLEMAGRRLRHELYAHAAAEFGSKVVALGHHADDQLELFFLRLLRGSGGEGFAGMKLISTLP